MSTKDLATLVLLMVVVLMVVHLWFGSHAPTNLQPFAGFPGGHPDSPQFLTAVHFSHE